MPNRIRKFIFMSNVRNEVVKARKNRLLDNDEWFLARQRISKSLTSIARQTGRPISVIAKRLYLMRKFDLRLVPERMRSYL